MKRLRAPFFGPLRIESLAMLLGLCCVGRLSAQTGTFIDRHLATDLRVATFNVFRSRIFPDTEPIQAEKFARIVNALDADIFTLQEVDRSAADVVALMDSIAPLASGSWHAHRGLDEGLGTVIVSKYPLSMLATSIDSGVNRPRSLALIDLPDAQFGADLYLVNHHYLCCGPLGVSSPQDETRQQESDATIRWIRDARTPGGSIDLPRGTPIAVVGDLNDIGGPGPLNTLLSGDVLDESTFGPDSPPDWNGNSFVEAHPLHNGVGPEDYTFRNSGSLYDRTRMDHIIYSASALDVGNKFVLNTADMSPTELAATGLQTFDVTIDSIGKRFDHIPVVTDFRVFDFSDSDFNFDRIVDALDFAMWESELGLGHGGDADDDGDTDGNDFLTWQRHLVSGSSAATALVTPEPSTFLLMLLASFRLASVTKKDHQNSARKR